MYLAMFIFAVGVLLVVVEVFLPSFGLLTLCACGCFALSVWMGYREGGTGTAVTMGLLAPALTIAILYLGLKFIPRTSWGRGLVLRGPADDDIEDRPTLTATSALTHEGGTSEETARSLVGKEGVAQSDLRPAGVAVVGGQRVDVVSEGGMVEAGARVKVVAVEGNRVVVRLVRL
ncbi:MAG: NfeD family protein [Candidatus Brocadiia bacterium]